MNLPRIFASAVARRLAVVLVALVLGWLGIGTARAANYPDQGAAFAGCTAAVSSAVSTLQALRPLINWGSGPCAISGTAYLAHLTENGVTYPLSNIAGHGEEFLHFFPSGTSCSTRPPTSGGLARVAADAEPASCDNGCAFRPGTQATLGVQLGSGGPMFYNMDGWLPTGDVCAPAPDDTGGGNDGEQCATQGNLTQCVKPDGRHCATASSGKQFCWQPTEHGTKTSGNEAATKSPPGESANIPPVAPPNGGDWKQQAQSTVTINNNTSNVTNWQSSYGNQGGGAAGGGADGQPNGGNGDGAGDGDGDADDHGTVSGGATCEQPLACAGGDPVLCAIAQQQYLARCEASGRGDGEVSPFPGTGDGGAGDDPSPAESHKTASPGLGWIDTTGILGGGSCPQFESVTTQFGDFAINGDDWCQIIGIARAALLIFGAFIALGILMGWGGKD